MLKENLDRMISQYLGSRKEKNDLEFNPWTLSFIGKYSALENDYYKHVGNRLLKQTQFAFVIAFFFYTIFSFLDIIYFPQYAEKFIFIRLVIVDPVIVLSLILISLKKFYPYREAILFIAVVIVGYGIIAMITIGGVEVNPYYYPGLILVFIFTFTFLGSRFINSLFANLTIIIGFELSSIITHIPVNVVILSNFFFLSTFLFSLIAGYSIEYYRRIEFFTHYLLEIEKERISYDNSELERRVEEKTEELVKAKEKAEKSDKLKSIFLAQMSHEIRTPINAILSLTSLIRSDLEEQVDDETKLSFSLVGRASHRIIRTIDLLLNLSEIQAGTYEAIPSKFDLYSDVLGKVVVDFKKAAEGKGVKLQLLIETEDTEIIADSYTVEQIFTQLVENAIKYTNKGKVIVRFYRDKGKNKTVEVIDTGIGISKEYLQDLFQPFTQEEMGYTRKYEGNGIGLALVQKYCELNNAKIEVESEKGKGSTFRVIFR